MRGQVVFRDCGKPSPASAADQLKSSSSKIDETAYAGVGICEVPTGTWGNNVIRPFVWQESSKSLLFSLQSMKLPAKFDSSDLACTLVSQQFSRPAPETGLSGGCMITRQSSSLQLVGREIVLVVFAMSLKPGSLRTDIVYEMSGNIGFWTHEHAPSKPGRLDLHEGAKLPYNPNGKSLAQIHRSPIWGWDDDKWGPNSTMDIAILKQCDRYERLEALESRSPEEDREFQELRKGELGWLFEGSRSDSKYIEFKAAMVNKFGQTQWTGHTTFTQQAMRDAAASQIVRKILSAP